MTITLGTVTLDTYVDFDGIKPKKNKKTKEFSFPGANISRFQNMGTNSAEWSVEGLIGRPAGDADAVTLEGYYDNDTEISFVYDETHDVKIMDFEIVDMITYWSFSLMLREV